MYAHMLVRRTLLFDHISATTSTCNSQQICCMCIPCGSMVCMGILVFYYMHETGAERFHCACTVFYKVTIKPFTITLKACIHKNQSVYERRVITLYYIRYVQNFKSFHQQYKLYMHIKDKTITNCLIM